MVFPHYLVHLELFHWSLVEPQLRSGFCHRFGLLRVAREWAGPDRVQLGRAQLAPVQLAQAQLV